MLGWLGTGDVVGGAVVTVAAATATTVVGGMALVAAHHVDLDTLTPLGRGRGAAMLGPSVQRVAVEVVPSTVKLEMTAGFYASEGSGIVLRSDGLILTNNHVVAVPHGMPPNEVRKLATFADGRTAPYSLVGGDAVSDIAVVRVADVTGLVPITIGTSADLRVGQEVVAVGAPLDMDGTVTTGIISALHRPVTVSGDGIGADTVLDAIQTDAAINPGSSGGALVDMSGALIGINSAMASAGGDYVSGQSGSIGLGFAVPVDQAVRVADELVATGHALHATLGAKVTDAESHGGARVLAVDPTGPAALAGIPNNAIITKVDDRVVSTAEALTAAIVSKSPGDVVVLTYTEPSGALRTVEVALGTE